MLCEFSDAKRGPAENVHPKGPSAGHAIDNVVNHYDYHATLMHLLGLSPEQLAYKRNGREESLLDGQPARIVHEILA